MGGGSPQPATTTTTVNNPQQQAIGNLAMPFIERFAQTGPPNLPSGGTVAPFDPAQVAGQEAILGAVPGMANYLGGAQGSSQFLQKDVLSPESNPALQGYINAATLPIRQQLVETTLPAIRSAATQAGQFGGSRQGIAEGLASGRASQAIGATAADIANKGYQTGLDAMVKNLALTPQTAQSLLLPGLATSGVGDVRQQMSQALLGQQNLYELYPQMKDLLTAQTLTGFANAFAPQGTTTTATGAKADPLMQGLGLGISGLGALGSLGGSGGIGALLPALAAFSDRRLKRNITKVGTFRGLNIYRYQFKRDERWHFGVMADEVPQEAVFDFCGFKVVDYSMLGVW